MIKRTNTAIITKSKLYMFPKLEAKMDIFNGDENNTLTRSFITEDFSVMMQQHMDCLEVFDPTSADDMDTIPLRFGKIIWAE